MDGIQHDWPGFVDGRAADGVLYISENKTQEHLPLPTHSNYRALGSEAVGQTARIITDLNVSIMTGHRERHRRSLQTRYYSAKTRQGGRWLLAGHTPRLHLESGRYIVYEAQAESVRSTNSKKPHAYVEGAVVSVIDGGSHERHKRIKDRMLWHGAEYVHYCPYRTKSFVTYPGKRLPVSIEECADLPIIESFIELYAFEDGILAIEGNGET